MIEIGALGLNGASATLSEESSRHEAFEVDIIVPVFNALEFVSECARSVLAHSGPHARLIIVNDASDAGCTAWLREFAGSAPSVRLIEHAQNLGYTRSCNTGLRASTAPFVVLLNSDTIVTPGWLDGLLSCARSSREIGLVGPLSNAASWQSVPRVVNEKGKFAVNAIPPELTIDDVATSVREASIRAYPRTPFLNGFCYLIRREVLNAIGLLDESRFPVGYGEENDFCIRAADAGYELAIADDVYVYHAKSKSFGDERRAELAAAGRTTLESKHGAAKVEALISRVKGLPLETMRRDVQERLEQLQRRNVAIDPLAIKVLFLLPVRGGGGGAHSVVQEAMAMRRLGVSANVAVRAKHHATLCQAYADIPGVSECLLPMADGTVPEFARDFDVVIATVYTSVELMERVIASHPEILPAYYVQDYEPLFFDERTPEWEAARASYERVPGALLFAKTDWLVQKVAERHGLAARRVVASLDHSVYFPSPRAERAATHIVAMVRPKTPRRGAARTMRVLAEVSRRAERPVVVHLFGCDSSHPDFYELPQDFTFANHGVLRRPEVAALLRDADLFIDLSDYQAFGRTGLEAMASGCAVILPKLGGTNEYAIDGQNAVLVDSSNELECVEKITTLVEDRPRLRRLRRAGLDTAARYSLHRAAVSELNLLSETLSSHRRSQVSSPRGKLALLPHADLNGETSAAGYVRVLQPWRHPKVQQAWPAQLTASSALPEPGTADIAILQINSPWARSKRLLPWLTEWRRYGGKLALEMTDDVGGPTARGTKPGAWPLEHPQVQRLSALADALLVPSERMRASVTKLNANVFVVPSYLDEEWAVRASCHDEPRELGPVRVGMLGSPRDANTAAPLTDAVRRLQDELGAGIHFEAIGVFEHSPAAFGERVGWPRRRYYPDYLAWLCERARWDIALLPVDGDGSPHADLTYLHYSALGVTTVASEKLGDTLIHGQTGLLVRDEPDAWYDAIRQLVVDAELRQRLAEAAHTSSLQRTIDKHSDLYLRTLAAVQALPARGRSASTTSRPRADGGQAQAPHARWPKAGAKTQAALARTAVGRKLRKLVRSPDAFFTDSKYRVVRELGSLLNRRR